MKYTILFYTIIASSIGFLSCKKDVTLLEDTSNSVLITPQTTELRGLMNGTLLEGRSYLVTADLIIPKGKEIIAQPGVSIIIDIPIQSAPIRIINHGSFISNGSEEKPNTISVAENRRPIDDTNASLWGGIYCSDIADTLILRWTKIEFTAIQANPINEGDSIHGYNLVNNNTNVIIENIPTKR